jgi:uncharacterized membrane protein YgdD (TMEM256/DUF423 family)
MGKKFLVIATLSMALAVLIGAFGAHLLEGRVAEDLMPIFKTGVDYHFYHSLGLLFIGLAMLKYPQVSNFKTAGYLFIAGTMLFSGSLYLMALTDVRWLGAITPFGGISMVAGWLIAARGIKKFVGDEPER